MQVLVVSKILSVNENVGNGHLTGYFYQSLVEDIPGRVVQSVDVSNHFVYRIKFW